MQLIGTIIVFLIGVVVGVMLHASGYLSFLPDITSYYPQSQTYPPDQSYSSYDQNYQQNQQYPTNQNSTYPTNDPNNNSSPNSYDTSQSYNSSTYGQLRLAVRCNVQAEDMPYGCAAAYTLVNRTARSLYVTFEGGDTQLSRANAPMTIAPGQSVGGNTTLRDDPNGDNNQQDSELDAAPPFVIEVRE